jgi:hypothetical protein
MNSGRTILLTAAGLLLAALALGGISLSQARLNRLRVEQELTETTPFENAPPVVAFTTVALGGFRGLLADYLWLRANRLQEAGNYFEMVQLADWIVKLQPRFTGATAFLAWNMAYNISVTFHSFEDRWRWVRQGLALIRDEALVYNPRDPDLYKELAWIYLHKVGQDMDDANRYYKSEMARHLIRILGEPAPGWDELAAAPADEAALRAALGAESPFWAALAAAGLSFADFERAFERAGALPPTAAVDALRPDARRTLELSLRRRWLARDYKLDAAFVLELNRRYGRFDWRLPQAHAIYWAHRGMAAAAQEKDLGCERIIFQGLNQAFKSGRLIYLRDSEAFETTPNIDLLDAADRSYLESMAKHPDNNSIRGGYENFLIDAIVILYTFGQRQRAAAYLGAGRRMYPGPKFSRTLDDFVLSELGEDMSSATYAQAQATVQGYLLQAYYALALGDDERASAFELIAQKLWQKYMREVGASSRERRGLPPYADMKRNMVERCQQLFPPRLGERLRQALPQPPPAEGAAPDAPAAGNASRG